MDDFAREYYRALDSHAYDELAELLDPAFVHHRPDRTIEGREAFVEFMREKRPMADTSHEVRTVYTAEAGAAVRGRLRDSDEKILFSFIDCFEFEGGDIAAIYTYTR